MLLVKELEFSLALLAQSVVDHLVLDEAFVLDEVLAEALLFGMGGFLDLSELVVQRALDRVQLVFLFSAEAKLFLEKSFLVFEKVFSLVIAVYLSLPAGDFAFEFVSAAMEVFFLVLKLLFCLSYFPLSDNSIFLCLELHSFAMCFQIVPHFVIILFEMLEFTFKFCVDFSEVEPALSIKGGDLLLTSLPYLI